MPAFLREDVEQMSWDLCPFIPLLPAVSGSWRKTLSNFSGAGRAVRCNATCLWSALSRSKIREAARVMNLAQGHGAEMVQESQCRRWYRVLQMKDALKVWAFPNPLSFCLPSICSAGLRAGGACDRAAAVGGQHPHGQKGKGSWWILHDQSEGERRGSGCFPRSGEARTHAHVQEMFATSANVSLASFPLSLSCLLTVPALYAADHSSPDTEALGFFFWGCQKTPPAFPHFHS